MHQPFGYHHPLETNLAAVPSSTALPDHTGLVMVIKKPLLKKDLGDQDCMAINSLTYTRLEVFMKPFQAGRPRMNLIPTSSPVLDFSLQDLNKRYLSLPGLCPPRCYTCCELLLACTERYSGRPKLLPITAFLSKGHRFSGRGENNYSLHAHLG